MATHRHGVAAPAQVGHFGKADRHIFMELVLTDDDKSK